MAHLHDVIDDDLHFIIDPDSRTITHASEEPIILIQNDHNSERFTFEVPRYICGHDTMLCNEVQVHFINIDANFPDEDFNADLYKSKDMEILDGNEDTLVFTWLIERSATGYVGPLNFAVRFMCTSEGTDENGNSTTIIDYSWNTHPFIGVMVSTGMDHSNEIVSKYYEVVDTWIASIAAEGNIVKNDTITRLEQVAASIESTAKKNMLKYAEEVKDGIAEYTMNDFAGSMIAQETGADPNKLMSQAATTRELADLETALNSQHVESVTADNARLAALEEIFPKLTISELCTPDGDNAVLLEKNKVYFIARDFDRYADTTDDSFHVTLKREINGTYTAPNGDLRHINIGETINNPSAILDTSILGSSRITINNYPYCYGFKIRVTNDGTPYLNEDTSAWISKSEVDFALPSDEPIASYSITNDLDQYYDDDNGLKIDVDIIRGGTITCTRCGVYAYPVDGTKIYEMTPNFENIPNVVITANGISDIVKTSTDGLTDTYTIILDDGTEKIFTVTNGNYIWAMTKVENDGYYDTCYIQTSDGKTLEFNVPNGNAIGIKTYGSGPIIYAEDVSPVEHKVGIKVRSRNIIPYPYNATGVIERGITYTDNGDGSITAAGTVPSGEFSVFKFPDMSDALKSGETYYMGGSDKMLLAYKTADGEIRYHKQGTFTWSDDYEFVQLYLQYSTNNGAISETIYPMICLASEGTEYTPYIAPNTVLVTKCGKNMFDPSKFTSGGWTESDGIYCGLPGKMDALYSLNKNPIYGVFEENTQYTLSFEGKAETTEMSTSSLVFIFTYSDGTRESHAVNSDSFVKYVFTSAVNKTLVGIYMSYSYNVRTHITDIQLEKGATATEYEPYLGTTQGVWNGGVIFGVVRSIAPTMTLFVNKPGAIIDATFNLDQAAEFNKLKTKIEALLNGGG